MIDILSILFSISFLMFLAYRGFSVLVLSPVLALIAVFLSGGDSLLAHYTQIFMVKLGDFATIYFPLFLLSAIFGKIMESSGCARSIADYISDKIGPQHAILAVVLSCAVLTYGGVSLFVVVFAVYPIAVELFRKSNTPKRLIPGAIALGAFTFTMSAVPGTPAIQNIIPCKYFGTNAFAAPTLSIIATLIMFGLGMMWLNREAKFAKATGEKYGNHEDKIITKKGTKIPNFWIAFIPVVMVIVTNYLCVSYIFPNIDTSFLQQEKYGSIEIKTVASNWAIIVSLFFAICFVILTNYKKIDITTCINNGASESLSPIFNTASVVGYGAVISSLPGFAIIRDWMLTFSGGNPIVSSSFVTSVLAGITGSASGGMSIALEMLGTKYLEMANALGISPEIIHRVVSISSGSLDTLPHNGAVITLLAICGLTHKDSYKDIFIVSLLVPILAVIASIVLSSMFGIF